MQRPVKIGKAIIDLSKVLSIEPYYVNAKIYNITIYFDDSKEQRLTITSADIAGSQAGSTTEELTASFDSLVELLCPKE
jgi:hypothetical protein